MPNSISFDKKRLLEGVDLLYEAVAPSLGARAYTAALDEGFRRRVIDDGVLIAKYVLPEDKVQAFGASLIAESARRTADMAGDGTSATVILAHAIIHESLKLIDTGVHPMALRKGLEDGIKLLIDEVDKIKTPITGLAQAVEVATISCKDPVLGKLIAETIHAMGLDGIVTVEESTASETYVDYQKGMRFESGYAHAAFVTHPEQMEAIYTNPKILILDKAVSFEAFLGSQDAIFPLIQKKGQSIVIIAPSLDPNMGEFLIENKRKGSLRALYINAPYAANFQKDFLRDLAILTGAVYIPLTEGGRIEDVKYSDLGECEKITSSHNSTLIVGGQGSKKEINNRIQTIKTQIKSTPSDFETEKLRERLAKLTTGVAVIKVGGSTEVEMQERKERAIDAVAATKAALEDGIVPGGERAYINILKTKQFVKERKYKNETEVQDVENANHILERALCKPFEQLLINSGLNVGEYRQKLAHKPYNLGVDVTTGEVVNMIEKGIIDPAKVIKCALKNSVSVAIQFLSINVIITPGEPVKKI